eukprot:6179450-Pleurochrysis_carterae.AAC.4
MLHPSMPQTLPRIKPVVNGAQPNVRMDCKRPSSKASMRWSGRVEPSVLETPHGFANSCT